MLTAFSVAEMHILHPLTVQWWLCAPLEMGKRVWEQFGVLPSVIPYAKLLQYGNQMGIMPFYPKE